MTQWGLLGLVGCLATMATTGESSFFESAPPWLSFTNSNFSTESTASTTGKVYWIRRSPDFTLLYVTVPIAAGMLLTVLIFFLWVFSSKPESLQDNFDYDRLDDESRLGSEVAGPSYPVLDQIFDLPYTNPVEVNDDLPEVV